MPSRRKKPKREQVREINWEALGGRAPHSPRLTYDELQLLGVVHCQLGMLATLALRQAETEHPDAAPATVRARAIELLASWEDDQHEQEDWTEDQQVVIETYMLGRDPTTTQTVA